MPDAPDALQKAWLSRGEAWQRARARLDSLAAARRTSLAEAARVVDDYRMLARELSVARRVAPQSRTRDFLEATYAQAHKEIHRSAVRPRYLLWSLFRDRLPQAVSELRAHIAWIVVLFLVATSTGWWAVHAAPQLAQLFASEEMIATVERGELWTDSILNVTPSSLLSVQLLTNNIAVSLFAYCAGFLFGLGTLYIIGTNGLMLGALFAMTARHGMEGRLLEFVFAHGLVELSCICLAGAAGASVGEALIRPQLASRGAAFAAANRRALPLLVAVILLLLGCGLIEGYVSPNPDIPLAARMSVGLGYFLFMIALLRGWMFGRSRGTPEVRA